MTGEQLRTIAISPEVADLLLRTIGLVQLSPAHDDFERDALLMVEAKRQLAVVSRQELPTEEKP